MNSFEITIETYEVALGIIHDSKRKLYEQILETMQQNKSAIFANYNIYKQNHILVSLFDGEKERQIIEYG